MNEYPELVKKRLLGLINEMAECPERFVKQPGKDFTRTRKINFAEMMQLILVMGGNSIGNKLMEYFSYDVNTSSTSTFIQQRNKILPSAFEFLMNEFTDSFCNPKTFNGYRSLAVDGSDLNIAHNIVIISYNNRNIGVFLQPIFSNIHRFISSPTANLLIQNFYCI